MTKEKVHAAYRIEMFLKDNPDKREVKNLFIENFVICEMECKEAILDFWHMCGRKLEVTDTDGIRLWPDAIRNALGPGTPYNYSDDFIKRLFGGKDSKNNPYKKKGSYSAKILRDKITHELLISAIEEVFARREELFQLMADFRTKYEGEQRATAG